MNYTKLLSGSDVRGDAEKELTDTFLRKFAVAFSEYLFAKKNKPQIVIGRDSRVSGKRIENTLIAAFTEAGIDVIQLYRNGEDDDVSTTPVLFEAVQHYAAVAGVIITASHLPQNWNGLKIFIQENPLPKNDLKALLEKSEYSSDIAEVKHQGSVIKKNFCEIYCSTMVSMIREDIAQGDEPLKKMKILVDAGNGASGFFAEKVLKPLGADTQGSLYLDPDGTFPNHIPNPEDKDALTDLCSAVKHNNADLGIIFDTDGDRSSVVLPDGKPVTGNRILALVYAMVLEEHKGSTVVSDSVTSDGLADFVVERGGIYRRYKRGYANVRNEMKRLNENGISCFAGGETSGHIMFTENRYADDGSYTVARLLSYYAQLRSQNKDFSLILKNLREPFESVSFRLSIREKDFIDYGKKVIDECVTYCEKMNISCDTTEGIRMVFTECDGWSLIRLSLHEPLLVINAESDAEGGVKAICSEVYSILKKYPKIDLKDLEKYIQE